MSTTDPLNETQKFTIDEASEVVERLEEHLRKREGTALAIQAKEDREDEFERQLLAKGVISHIPSRDETDDEFDRFEPIEVGGEPLSETIVRERR